MHAFCRLWIILIIFFLKNIFLEYHQSVKQFGSRSGPTKLFAKVISRRQKLPQAGKQLSGLFLKVTRSCDIEGISHGNLFVLRFYGPVNPMGSCRARSVYLTARLLGRLSPLSG